MKYFAIMTLCLLIGSCQKDKSDEKTKTKEELSPIIYAVGTEYYYTPSAPIKSSILLWKISGEDIQATKLTENQNFNFACCVFVYNGNVYTAGIEDVSYYSESTLVRSERNGKIWKNNQLLYTISNIGNHTIFKDMAISDRGIYVVGYDWEAGTPYDYKTKATVWINGGVENGGKTIILNSGNDHAQANSITIDNEDYYVAGGEWEQIGNSTRHIAKVWKNGQEFYRLLQNEAYSNATSISISNSVIYTTGILFTSGRNRVIVLKNESLLYSNNISNNNNSNLPAENRSFYITTSGKDVYVAGEDLKNGGATYLWKNGGINNKGQTMELDIGYSTSIFHFGSDIYVGGCKNETPTIWINGGINNGGKTIYIPNNGKNSVVESIFVQNQNTLLNT